MEIRTTRARFLGTALLTASFAVLSPAVQVEAQAAQQTAAAPSVDDERLTQYARLHVAINQARDEFQAAKARVHDFEARERLREEMDERLSALYEEHGMSKEDYDGLTFMVSIDSGVRTRLEAILAELRNPSEN
jgi:hypothetical protein